MIAAFTTAACTSADRNAIPAGETGGTLIIALPAEPLTLMPPLVRYAHEKVIADQVFDVLGQVLTDASLSQLLSRAVSGEAPDAIESAIAGSDSQTRSSSDC